MDLNIFQLDPNDRLHNEILAWMDWRRRQGHTNMYFNTDFEVVVLPDGTHQLKWKGDLIITVSKHADITSGETTEMVTRNWKG